MSYKEIINKYLIQIVIIIVFIFLASIVSGHYELMLFMVIGGGGFLVYVRKNKQINNGEKQGKMMQYEFVNFYYLTMIFANEKTDLTSAIKKGNEYEDDEMQTVVYDLLINLDRDKSVTPFINFADYFANYDIKELMVKTYNKAKKKDGADKIQLGTEIEDASLIEITRNEEKKMYLGDIFPITCFLILFIMFFSNIASTIVVNVHVA